MASAFKGALRARLIVRQFVFSTSPGSSSRLQRCRRNFMTQQQRSTSQLRPNLPFLYTPSSSGGTIRYASSITRKWLRHEMKLVVRYTAIIWGVITCVLIIAFAISMEVDERKYPTPHEWGYLTRGCLRFALDKRWSQDILWVKVINSARDAIRRLEDANLDGKDLVKVFERHDPESKLPYEFSGYDITHKSEEWRRGYFQALMLVADSSQHVEGWMRDEKQHVISPPEFVVGPSNPRPKTLPPGKHKRPREEDCVAAFPPAEAWFVKILATRGFTPRQRIEAALAYANYMSLSGRPEGIEPLHQLALAEATQGTEDADLPYNKKTYVLKNKSAPPSANVLDVVTDIALHKVRNEKDGASAMPIFISLLKARRALPNAEPRTPATSSPRKSTFDQLASLVSQPPYPAPPPDGTQVPWRSPEERCHEASLNMYIGEILFASTSRDDGLAWTRDAVDLSEEELRKIGVEAPNDKTKVVCRSCLRSSLSNWQQMVNTLAREEEQRKQNGSGGSNVLSFWSGSQHKNEGRWEAERAVVEDHIRRTEELVEDIKPPQEGIIKYFKA